MALLFDISSYLSDLLFSTPVETPAPPNVHIVPCSTVDLSFGRKERVLTLSLVIDTCLDAPTLEQTLSTLVVHKFPRAGARLVLRNEELEFHIPSTFDADHPPIAFTAHHYRELYASSTRPDIRGALSNSSDSAPSLLGPLPSLEMYSRSPTCPVRMHEFLVPKTPLLQVHVSVFDDLTIIGVTSSEIMFDVTGMRTLLDTWTRLLSGADIEKIQGMDLNMASPFARFKDPAWTQGIRGYESCEPLMLFMNFEAWLVSLLRDREEEMLIRVPKAYLEDRRLEIMGDLKLQGSSERVETADVLMAWWLKTSYSHRESDDKTHIWIHLSVDLRPMHIFTVSSSSGSDAPSPLTDPYIHNASSTIPLLPPPLASELQSTSLGALALRIRRAITAYIAHPALIERELAWLNYNPRRELIRGEEHETQTDWAAARFSELDFSGARALESDCKGSGRVLFVLPKTVLEPYMPLWGHGGDFDGG
ncbi:hypothetical protein B0H14DRAFT_2498757 [Mycena olivaceomarginata]|nr:hypothetical protein B0H14DRAFT_2498757 [Mycena olivaceomarginata]